MQVRIARGRMAGEAIGEGRRAMEACLPGLQGLGIRTAAKRQNLRSIRLLERLGFSQAEPDPRGNHQIEPGEVPMSRRLERA
jgi:hypothetical protein